MSSIKDEPTEGESPLNPSTSVNESTEVKCEWTTKSACSCDDGQCEDCQEALKETDEIDNILRTTADAVSPLNSPENDETEFHPPIWEDCEAAKETGKASDVKMENVKPVIEIIDGNLDNGLIIEQVNPPKIKEEIPDIVEERNVNKETKLQIDETSPISSRRSARPREAFTVNVHVTAVDEVIVKSESEDGEMEIVEVIHGTVSVPSSPGSLCQSTQAGKGFVNVQMPKIEQSNTAEIREESPENVEEEAGQAEASESSLSLRRSSRVRKRPVNYALLPEAEEETQQDEPETDTSDTEESDSSNSESEIDSEMETDPGDPSETEESGPIAANDSSGTHFRRSVSCRQGKRRFASKATTRRHHQIKKPRPFVCSQPDCGAAFGSQSRLDAHTIIHTDLRPFTCGTCGATFNREGSLVRHQSTHTNARPYVCAVCKMAFKRNHTLVRHTMLHSGSKPFTCADCGASFTQNCTLERHRQGKTSCASRFTPSERRPFLCAVAGCGRAYKDRQALGKHRRTHSALKPAFKCTVCKRAFTCRGTLKTHNRKFHQI